MKEPRRPCERPGDQILCGEKLGLLSHEAPIHFSPNLLEFV
jgi:hypothetical protein